MSIKPLAAQPSSWPSHGEAVFELTGEGVKAKFMEISNNHCSGWAHPISLGWYISLEEGSLWSQNQGRQTSLALVGNLPRVWCLNKNTEPGVKTAVRHQIFPTDLIKLPISYVDKLSKMSNSKKKKKIKKSLQ